MVAAAAAAAVCCLVPFFWLGVFAFALTLVLALVCVLVLVGVCEVFPSPGDEEEEGLVTTMMLAVCSAWLMNN